jgi:hypothetical protein
MSDENLVPHTPIYQRYLAVKAPPQAQKVLRAREIAADPAALAVEFAESVAMFGEGYRGVGPFRGKPRTPPSPEARSAHQLKYGLRMVRA